MTAVSTEPPGSHPPASASVPAGSGGRSVVFRGRDFPIVLPKLRDPRLKLSAIILILSLLGQTVLNFKVSAAQMMLSILLCAVIEASRVNVIIR
ncbi:MAG: hypothetical protein ACR2LJ_00545 [Acidimicrobiales bacterium]